MKRMASVLAIAAMSLASAPHALAETNFDVFDPIGKGPAKPFRTSVTETCDGAALCKLTLGKAPKGSILILETVMCLSTPPAEPLGNFGLIGTKTRIVAALPPSANPGVKLVTNAYMPFHAGETVQVQIGAKSGETAVCTGTGRLLPAGAKPALASADD